jgi:hypothetical protein
VYKQQIIGENCAEKEATGRAIGPACTVNYVIAKYMHMKI